MPAESSKEASSRKAVVILGPPWPRSGTARVIQNQVEYYRQRGFITVFICVPIHSSFTKDYSEWENIKTGMRELGADHTLFATIDSRKFTTSKYTTWAANLFRGTALDWIVFTGASARISEAELRLIRGMDIKLIDVNHVFTLGFADWILRQISTSNHQVQMILETHDVQAHLLHERREINGWTHGVDSLERLLRRELALVERAQALVHCSVDDFNYFKPRLPLKPHVLALPSIDENFVALVQNARPLDDPIDLLFVGQSTDPNSAAIKWFLEEVWPLIADRGYRLKIVGQIDLLIRRDMPQLFDRFGSHFVGPVAELAPYYRSARCVFAPMISGTGISIKTVEALALGKPFVGTSKAYRGMPMDRIEQAGLRAYDTAQEFADAIVSALADEPRASAISRRAYDATFSKQAIFASRDEALRITVGS
jgi:glycosyltransferase involved in cell wall biosynthesis